MVVRNVEYCLWTRLSETVNVEIQDYVPSLLFGVLFASYPIHAFGMKNKEQISAKMAAGELIGCFGLTEPDHGSNPGGMVARAVDDGDSYVINEFPSWITNGTSADLAIVWAKLGGDRSRDIRGFIVEKDDIGFPLLKCTTNYSSQSISDI